ncbi:flagellar assembly protein FliX [Muricoccus pecuniae]|uniref:Class II flagellar assembly regulator n=1 Tax=Muricoccus pecuniae TaxID=693023 RepID=A0A840YIB8_9PROT|nr:flagellar assembly protein FliX [Roseomonas pecuniae]MBB5693664.1 hypothetical protein [Roseomonas pecuniae]
MIGINGTGRAGMAGPARPAARGGGGFRLSQPAAREAEGAAAAAPATAVGLVALQEAGDDAERDRRGHARARDLLKEMSALQAEMLGSGVDPARLTRIAALAEGEQPADPVLADALAGIALRARIELARHGLAIA